MRCDAMRELAVGDRRRSRFVEYSNSPEAHFPTAIEQGYATAAQWVIVLLLLVGGVDDRPRDGGVRRRGRSRPARPGRRGRRGRRPCVPVTGAALSRHV